MSGGSHRSKNPHGSPTGRKGRGDINAEKKLGRKRMYDEKRKKGPQIAKIVEPVEFVEWTDNQVGFIWFLFCRQKFSEPGLLWEDILRELKLIGITPDEANTFMTELTSLAEPWLIYNPEYSAYLDRGHFDAIREFCAKELKKRSE